MNTHVKDVTNTDFVTEVVERSHDVPVVVDFWAAWCGPCKVLGPVLERLASEGGGNWELAKVDVDQHPQLAGQFGVQGIPTVIGFRGGEPVARFTGALPEAQVRSFIEQLRPSDLDLKASVAEDALEAGDTETAARLWRVVLEAEPNHALAGAGLAGLLIEQGDSEAALEILGRLAPTPAVRRLQAAARLAVPEDLSALRRSAESGDSAALIAYARGLAAHGQHSEAFEVLIDVVARREEGTAEAARLLVLDLFELLGPDHPLSSEYRRRLANALF